MSKSKSIHSSQELSSSSCTSSSVSSDEDSDAQDLKPIKDYLRNHRELARQLFQSVKPEKIRMMLPQALKKMDLGELEEWCASELSGMSKSRILSILNGKPMVDSSDTSESMDSGPSLEIISDTEEWFSDEDMSKVDEEGLAGGKSKIKRDKNKLKGKGQIHEKNDIEKSKAKVKPSHKDKNCNKYKDVKVKTENDKEANKDKESDSLLDLLELEMRARAIRALIRKEEDVLPGTSASKSVNKESSNENSLNKTIQDDLKEKENCQRQLEKIISVQQGNVAEDEDVVLVVQPTPTIELLSSESEEDGHGGTRINKKLENERVMEVEKNVGNREKENQNYVNHSTVEPSKEAQGTKEMQNKDKDATRHKAFTRFYSDNVDHKGSQESEKPESNSEKRRKVKKKSHSKERQRTSNAADESSKAESNDVKQTVDSAIPNSAIPLLSNDTKNVQDNDESVNSDTKTAKSTSPVEQKDSVTTQNTSQKSIPDEEKSTDLEEIIDLDDYCDDMEDMENYDNDKNKSKKPNEVQQQKPRVEPPPTSKSASTETWASRYYQTDDVQNVIKESKIQSEIRKRLRERQRLSKLSKSPNSTPPSSNSVVETASDKKTMGSVDEYLALKRTSAIGLNTVSNNDNANVSQEQTESVESGTASSHCEEENVNKQTTVIDNVNTQSVSSPKQSDTQINTNDQANPG